MATMVIPRSVPRLAPGILATSRAGAELLLIAVFYVAYSMVRVIMPHGAGNAFEHAGQIMEAESALGLDMELALNKAFVASGALSAAANIFYATAHFAVTAGILIWLYARRSDAYAWLRTGLMAATGAALIGYWAYPLAPPRFMTDAGFADPVLVHDTPGLYSAPGANEMTNQFAAMPSMHAGWALWCAVAIAATVRTGWIRWAAFGYPVLTVLVIMGTANHYSLDFIAGFAITGAALGLSFAAHRKFAPSGRPFGLLRRLVSLLTGGLRRPAGALRRSGRSPRQASGVANQQLGQAGGRLKQACARLGRSICSCLVARFAVPSDVSDLRPPRRARAHWGHVRWGGRWRPAGAWQELRSPPAQEICCRSA